MNTILEKIQATKQKYPRTWSQQVQRDDEIKSFVINKTSWITHEAKFSERVCYLENGLTEYKKCKCGRDITNLKAKTCKQKDCDAFKLLLNKSRDKEAHRLSVKKTYEDGTRKDVSGVDRAKISYRNQQELFDSITEVYTLEETIDLLNPLYKKYFGKAGNRTLLKDNPKLYKSVKYHTEKLRKKSNTQLRFTGELIFLCEYDGDINKLRCKTHKCNGVISYQAVEKCFKHEVCCDCYEPEIGKVSIISQELFDNIECFVDRECVYYKKGGEVKILLSDDEKKYLRLYGYQNNKFFIDFVCENKIIEYDADYWHKSRKEYDKLRDTILEKRGYTVLRISDSEYNNTKKGMRNKQKTIEKCVEFLNG